MSGRMGQSKAHEVKKAATMRASGKTMREIGEKIDRSIKQVVRILKTDEARDIMKACHSRIISAAPKAVDNILEAVDDFQEAYKEGNKVRAGISWEATKLVTQIPGLSPTAQPSIVHQTFINKTTNVIDPMIVELMKRHLSGVVDIEGEQIDSILIEGEDHENTI